MLKSNSDMGHISYLHQGKAKVVNKFVILVAITNN